MFATCTVSRKKCGPHPLCRSVIERCVDNSAKLHQMCWKLTVIRVNISDIIFASCSFCYCIVYFIGIMQRYLLFYIHVVCFCQSVGWRVLERRQKLRDDGGALSHWQKYTPWEKQCSQYWWCQLILIVTYRYNIGTKNPESKCKQLKVEETFLWHMITSCWLFSVTVPLHHLGASDAFPILSTQLSDWQIQLDWSVGVFYPCVGQQHCDWFMNTELQTASYRKDLQNQTGSQYNTMTLNGFRMKKYSQSKC